MSWAVLGFTTSRLEPSKSSVSVYDGEGTLLYSLDSHDNYISDAVVTASGGDVQHLLGQFQGGQLLAVKAVGGEGADVARLVPPQQQGAEIVPVQGVVRFLNISVMIDIVIAVVLIAFTAAGWMLPAWYRPSSKAQKSSPSRA